VATRLRAAGHTVYAPSLDGCAERKHQVRAGITTETHATEIADMLFYEDLNDVVMVGTSSGGMVLCRAAETARERIARVVFVDALALFDGERIRDIVQRSTAVPSGLTAGPSRQDAETRLFADLDPATRAWALDRYTLHPIGIYEHPVRLQSFWTQPWVATVIWCRPGRQPRRGASAPHRRAPQGKVVRARHRPLSDAQLAGRANGATDRVVTGVPFT
jgi:pimeloyl-ACP methyl ester carboxylesterase